MSAMEAKVLLDAQVQAKRIYSLLSEVLDLSNQLAEAIDREDRVVVQMLVDMRDEPIKKLQTARTALQEQKDGLEEASRERLTALLNGEPAANPEEAPLEAQIASNKRLLQRVLELDQRLNRKITGAKSIYN